MEYEKGQKVKISKVINRETVEKFAELSGDYNPIHLDEEFAEKSRFKRCIAHGMIGASFISAVLGTEFPGNGTIYLEQQLRFTKPIYIGECVTVEVEILEILQKGNARLRTDLINQDEETVIKGEALVKLPA